MTPQETDPDLPVSVWESLAEAWIHSGTSSTGVPALVLLLLEVVCVPVGKDVSEPPVVALDPVLEAVLVPLEAVLDPVSEVVLDPSR